MSIDLNDARHVAELARLELTENELKTYTGQLNQILDYARELEQVNTDQVEPTYHSIAQGAVLREDVVQKFADQAGLLENGPDISDGSFVVPRIL